VSLKHSLYMRYEHGHDLTDAWLSWRTLEAKVTELGILVRQAMETNGY
jgi:hypothetical protein